MKKIKGSKVETKEKRDEGRQKKRLTGRKIERKTKRRCCCYTL